MKHMAAQPRDRSTSTVDMIKKKHNPNMKVLGGRIDRCDITQLAGFSLCISHTMFSKFMNLMIGAQTHRPFLSFVWNMVTGLMCKCA